MSSVIEWLTPIGSAVGFLTGCFVLVERVMTGRPSADWINYFERHTALLRITNTSKRWIHIRAGGATSQVGWAPVDEEIRGFIKARFFKGRRAIPPGEHVDLQFIPVSDDMEPTGAPWIFVGWSCGHLPQFPLAVHLNWAALKLLLR